MTEEEIWDWQCKMHLWSCFLYEVDDDAPLDDKGYDNLCQMLLRRYDSLPEWYRVRVTQGDLSTGTGSVVAKGLTPEEEAEARWWRDEHIPAMKEEANAALRALQGRQVPARRKRVRKA